MKDMRIAIFKGEDHYEVERAFNKWSRETHLNIYHINTTIDKDNNLYITIGYNIGDK